MLWVRTLLAVASGLGLFLSSWVVIPAPTRFWLTFSVGAPEVSPWLAAAQVAVLGGLLGMKAPRGWLLVSALGLALSLLPLLQLPATHRQFAAEMRRGLGADYLAAVPEEIRDRLRWSKTGPLGPSQPWTLSEAIRGIPQAPVTLERQIFARPEGVSLRLNLYQPPTPGPYPTVVMIYGGAWQSGSPESNQRFSRYLAARGYAVAAIDYRHAPTYRFPTQLEDVRTALDYLQDQAQALNLDLSRLALMGRSAGAQLATIAAYEPAAPPVKAVINYYGPVDLTEGYRSPPIPDPIDSRAVLEAFLGGTPDQVPERYRQASPVHYVRSNLPPTLLVYGGRDHVVLPRYGYHLYQQLRQAGSLALWLPIPWADHAFDAVFNGPSNQLALYYTERFLAWALR